jgi:serine/threonine protein kinase
MAFTALKASKNVTPGGGYSIFSESILGKGTSAEVKLATNVQTGDLVAVKIITKKNLTPLGKELLSSEVDALKRLKHSNIVKLHDLLEDEEFFYIMMDYVRGEDLCSRIENSRTCLSERECKYLTYHILKAIEHCHSNGIIHRDIKLENLIYDAEKKRVVLVDFGLCEVFPSSQHNFSTLLNVHCGSPLYAAPELLKGVPYYGPPVDIWSLGVVLFAMLVGELPFVGETYEDLIGKACNTPPALIKLPASPHARDLISKMLEKDPQNRITVSQMKQHPWLAEMVVMEQIQKEREEEERLKREKKHRIMGCVNANTIAIKKVWLLLKRVFGRRSTPTATSPGTEPLKPQQPIKSTPKPIKPTT